MIVVDPKFDSSHRTPAILGVCDEKSQIWGLPQSPFLAGFIHMARTVIFSIVSGQRDHGSVLKPQLAQVWRGLFLALPDSRRSEKGRVLGSCRVL